MALTTYLDAIREAIDPPGGVPTYLVECALFDRPGIYGMLNFQANPQRGVLPEWIVLVRWDPAKGDFFAASKPGGSPL